MKLYKEFYVEDMLDLLEKANRSNHLSRDCVNSDVASLIYDYFDSIYDNYDLTEDLLYDFIRFELEIQSEDQIRENYEEAKEYEDIVDFITNYSSFVGVWEDDVDYENYYLFTQF